MGVDFSHGEAHFGHGAFHAFRRTLASMIGVSLDQMMGFGGNKPWSEIDDPLAPFLSRNDAGGELSPEEARAAADRLEELMSSPENREQAPDWDRVLEGLAEAARLGEPFVIMG